MYRKTIFKKEEMLFLLSIKNKGRLFQEEERAIALRFSRAGLCLVLDEVQSIDGEYICACPSVLLTNLGRVTLRFQYNRLRWWQKWLVEWDLKKYLDGLKEESNEVSE